MKNKRQYSIDFNLDNTKISDLIVTDMCNMNCPFCIASYMLNRVRKKMSVEDVHDWAIPQLKDAGITHVGISGGEPSLLLELPEICKMLYEAGFNINIASNGYSIDILGQCSQYINYVSLSLNSLSTKQVNEIDDTLSCQLRLHGLIWKGHNDNINSIVDICSALNDDIIVDFSTLRTTNLWASAVDNLDITRTNKFIVDHVIPESCIEEMSKSTIVMENGYISTLDINGKHINIFLRDKTSNEIYEPTDKQLILTFDRKMYYGFNEMIRDFNRQ